jgi:hypothetical protein
MASTTSLGACAASILLLVLVSGCATTSTKVESGSGVVIKDYSISFPELYSGECADFGALIKNTGSVKAEKVFAEIIGLDYDWYDKSKIAWNTGCKSQDGGPWKDWEKDANEPECRFMAYSSGGYTVSLLPPDPAMGTDGQSRACTWTYKVPKIPDETTITYKPVLRVYYKYRTDVIKAITLLSEEEMKNLVKQGKTLSADTQSSTSSPVSLDVVTSTPIRTYADRIEFPITVNINNAGGGMVCSGRGTFDSWDKIEDCRPSQKPEEAWNRMWVELEADKEIRLSQECQGKIDITLYQGKSNSITCTATVNSRDLPSTYVQKMVKVHAYYNYLLDREIEITVHGSV